MPKQRNRTWYRIENKADDDTATVYLYDAIVNGDDYFGGVSAEGFVKDLHALDVETIHLRINSPGGSVFPAMAIYTALRQHSARVVAHIDGLAASAASFIALAANEVRMTKGAFYMIHNGHVLTIGDKAALRETANLLEKIDAQIVDIYAGKTGMSDEDVRAAMDAETWYTAQEAEEAGFVDAIDEAEPVEAAFDLTPFAHVPEPLAKAAELERREIKTVRDLEDHLRDEGGYSNAAAKKIVAALRESLSEPRDEDGEGAEPTAEAEEEDLAALDAALNQAVLRLKLAA